MEDKSWAMPDNDLLNRILGDRARVDLLRLLWSHRVPLTFEKVAALSGLEAAVCCEQLTVLANLGVLTRATENITDYYGLNQEHLLVQKALSPLFETEESFHPEFCETARKTLRETGLQRSVVSLWLMRNTPGGEEIADRPPSPIHFDLILIQEEEGRREDIERFLALLDRRAIDRFGARVRADLVDIGVLIEAWGESPGFLKAAIGGYWLIEGWDIDELEEILQGKTPMAGDREAARPVKLWRFHDPNSAADPGDLHEELGPANRISVREDLNPAPFPWPGKRWTARSADPDNDEPEPSSDEA